MIGGGDHDKVPHGHSSNLIYKDYSTHNNNLNNESIWERLNDTLHRNIVRAEDIREKWREKWRKRREEAIGIVSDNNNETTDIKASLLKAQREITEKYSNTEKDKEANNDNKNATIEGEADWIFYGRMKIIHQKNRGTDYDEKDTRGCLCINKCLDKYLDV